MPEIILPADLPENLPLEQIIAPNGSDIGMPVQYGYNYLLQQVNNAHRVISQQVELIEKLEADLANKANNSITAECIPEIKTSDNNQDFEYNGREGYYSLIGDEYHYYFALNISNIMTSNATGFLTLELPVTYAKTYANNPIYIYFSSSNNNVSGLWFGPAGNFIIGFTDGTAANFSMHHINKENIENTRFQIRGKISYLWQ